MGILDSGLGNGLSALGLGSLGSARAVESPRGKDFTSLTITEIIDGRPAKIDAITLAGSFMPLIPFEYGGSQQIIKDYYPGNSEPVVQVLGPREKDTIIRGRMKTKRFEDVNLREAALEYQELMDAMRLRGNLVRIEMGHWYRYGFIEETNFKLNLITDIEYEIKLSIVGFNLPSNTKMISQKNDDLIAPNKQITNQAAAALLAAQAYPDTMPRGIAETINELVSDIAEKIVLVTSFVDGVVGDAEKIVASANRAIGLIKNARATISRTTRRVGQIATSAESLGAQVSTEAEKTQAVLENVNHLHKIQNSNASLNRALATMQKQFAALSAMTPLFRHLVRQGDTLQTLSTKYYGKADYWINILAHNRLASTQLVKGQVLVIPKV